MKLTETSGGSGGSGGLTGESVSTGKCLFGGGSGGGPGCAERGRAVIIIFKEEEQCCIKPKDGGGGVDIFMAVVRKQSFRERREELRGWSWGDPSERHLGMRT
ncbi:Uncharacterized protein Rs2_42389 [Raphanus sativus]|nr:Uncharacterized protein Rs2_42389 [Raphanus sativus]